MESYMGFLGNILWFILGGEIMGLLWFAIGILWCCTIIGIPIGIQCFKMAGLSFWPFGRDVIFNDSAVSVILNVIWIVVSGCELAIANLIFGLVFCCTIIGIPFGIQYFKMAKLSLLPFGATIRRTV